MQCNEQEAIPLEVVREFDAMDDGDPTVPPQFSFEKCGGEMYPEFIKDFMVTNIKYQMLENNKRTEAQPRFFLCTFEY